TRTGTSGSARGRTSSSADRPGRPMPAVPEGPPAGGPRACEGTPMLREHAPGRDRSRPGRARARTRVSRWQVALWVVAGGLPLLFLAVFFALPVVTMVARGFVTDGALDLTGFGEVFARPRTLRIIGLTLGQAAAATAVALLLGLPGAYVLYRRSFPGQRLVRALVAVPFVLPTVVVGVAFRSLLSDGGPLGGLGLDE